MHDKPSQALRRGRKNSSMWLAIDAVKKGEADVAVSAGNTGALMAMARFCLRTMPGIDRPAIAGVWPTMRGDSVVLDLGATIGGDAHHLVSMAVMGSAMASVLFDRQRPTVGLLNIGVEEVKGHEEIREAREMLRAMNLPQLEYIGFVEGDGIGKGAADVIVTEGFSGNIALKAAEGTARQIADFLRNAMATQLDVQNRLFAGTRRLQGAAGKAGSEQVQWRRAAWTERRGGQEPWRNRMPKALPTPSMLAMRRSATISSPRSIECSIATAVRWPGADRAGGCLVTAKRSVVLGCGSYLPQKVLTNAELAARIDTSDEWIVQRTGIQQRHIAAEGEFTSHLAINAARAALEHAGLDAQAIDLIVLATSTPDNTFPATAVAVQNGLGIHHGAAFDLQAVCSGFVFALATADNFLRGGAYKRALVIGAETFSRILDWNDRGTCVLFGDGAGAVVLEAQDQPGKPSDRGMLTTHLRSDGRHKSKLYRRWRSVLDPDRRPSADGRPRGVQARGRHDHRRDRGCLQGHRR